MDSLRIHHMHHTNTVIQNTQSSSNKAFTTVKYNKWKSKFAEGWRCEIFIRQILRGMERMPPLSCSKALCLSSLLLSDVCTLALGILSHTISYIFSQSNYLLNSMTKDTMDSRIHSVVACSLKSEKPYKRKKRRTHSCKPEAGDYALRQTF